MCGAAEVLSGKILTGDATALCGAAQLFDGPGVVLDVENEVTDGAQVYYVLFDSSIHTAAVPKLRDQRARCMCA
jgi:hypothetical protein